MWDLHVNSSLRLSASVSKHGKWLFALSCCFFRKINDFLYNWFCCWFLLNCHVVGSISLATNNWFVYSWFLASFIKERDFLIGFYVVNGWYAITLNACLSPTCYLIGKLARAKKNPAIPNDQAVVQWTSNLTSQRKGMQRPLSATWTQVSWILSQWVDLLGAVPHGDVDVARVVFLCIDFEIQIDEDKLWVYAGDACLEFIHDQRLPAVTEPSGLWTLTAPDWVLN